MSINFHLTTCIEKDKNQLGQFLTSNPVAEFMLSLIQEKISDDSTILDPCIGPNTFFANATNKIKKAYLTGIEIDSSLLTDKIKNFYIDEKRTLIIDNFFNLSIDNKFDFIIQNPPFVRQEIIAGDDKLLNYKKHMNDYFFSLGYDIPSKSNLYIYFILKSILHLKENGVIVAIIYDSWLFTEFGNFLKQILIKLGNLRSIYHLKKRAFPNVEVGGTIIYFQKSKPEKTTIDYYPLSDFLQMDNKLLDNIQKISIYPNQVINYNFNLFRGIDFSNSFFISLASLSDQPIQRGISSLINKYFIHEKTVYEESKPFIKDVKKIQKYMTKNETAYLLAIQDSISEKTMNYLEYIKSDILSNTSKYKSIQEKIKSGGKWYQIDLKKTGNFIFNYYLRDNIHFIYNPNHILIADNFYILNINIFPFAYLSILNSTFTNLSVLSYSRNQGGGLKKIQANEFKKVCVIDINKLTSETIVKLNELGETLSSTNRYNGDQNLILRKIDTLLLNEYNSYRKKQLTLEDIYQYKQSFYQ